MRRQICVCMAVSTAAVAVGASFPLEWNGTYATDVPYEVDVNTVKLARVAAAAPGGGFAVAATLPDGTRDLSVVQLGFIHAFTGGIRNRFNMNPVAALQFRFHGIVFSCHFFLNGSRN